MKTTKNKIQINTECPSRRQTTDMKTSFHPNLKRLEKL